jgi:DNA repair exonuclease SbcCD ATPase subunit
MLTAIEQQMDKLEAKRITALSEVKEIQNQIDKLTEAENELTESKGFFNRTKIDEELERLTSDRKALEAKRREWERYSNNNEEFFAEKERLQQQYQTLRLKKAIVEKEFRQIDTFFGSFEEFNTKLLAFLAQYTGKELIEIDERNTEKSS